LITHFVLFIVRAGCQIEMFVCNNSLGCLVLGPLLFSLVVLVLVEGTHCSVRPPISALKTGDDSRQNVGRLPGRIFVMSSIYVLCGLRFSL